MTYNSSICFSTDCMRIVVVVCALDCRDGIGRHFTPFDKQVFIPSNHQIQDFSLYLYHKVKLTQLFFCIGEYIRTFSICIDDVNKYFEKSIHHWGEHLSHSPMSFNRSPLPHYIGFAPLSWLFVLWYFSLSFERCPETNALNEVWLEATTSPDESAREFREKLSPPPNYLVLVLLLAEY